MAGGLSARTKRKVIPFEQNGQFYYRKAKKYVESNNYIDALSFYRKAVEKDPENLEYRLDLAQVFTEMGYYEESNQILLYILQRDENNADCYFCLGCNFLGLQEYERAKECFEKYLQLDPDGIYSEDAQDLLDILQSHEIYFDNDLEVMLNPGRERLYKLANKGKNFLDMGDYKRAIRCLESVVKKDPSLIFARNNLALAYFCVGRLDDAISVCQGVLKEQPQNVHANCNIAIFYHEKGLEEESEKHLQTVLGIETNDPEEIHKIAVTLCELKKHKEANRLLKRLIQYKPYDIKILHYIAVSYFNTQRYKEALKYWSKIDKIAPNNTISSFYKRLTHAIMTNEREFSEISYHFQVPYEEIICRIKKINDLLRLPHKDLKKRWSSGDELLALLKWGLELNDPSIKRAILSVIASFKDEKAESFLREFILKKSVDDELKREAVMLLKQMGAPEPYIAYLDDNIVQIKIDVVAKNPPGDLPQVFRDVVNMAVEMMKERYQEGFEVQVREIWNNFVSAMLPYGLPRIRKPEAWAAALELYYCLTSGFVVDKTELAHRYGASYSTISNACRRISLALLENEYNKVTPYLQ